MQVSGGSNVSDIKIAFKILTKVDTLAPILFLNRTQFAKKRTLLNQAGNWEKTIRTPEIYAEMYSVFDNKKSQFRLESCNR